MFVYNCGCGWDNLHSFISLLLYWWRIREHCENYNNLYNYTFFRAGFDGTSNVMAGMIYGVPIKGTHAHSFVSSFNAQEEDRIGKLQPADSSKSPRDFYPETVKWLKKLAPVLNVVESETNDGERVGFSAYATAFPTSFLALVDTYNVLR